MNVPWRTALLLLVLVTACGDVIPPGARPRSVLLVTLDTVRADFLGSYGGRPNTSPQLDRFAKEGVRFDTAISTAAVTPVSHASILTGRDPYSHGLRILSGEGGFRLGEEIPTLASELSRAGFRTGAVHSSFTVSGYFGFGRNFDVFESIESALGGEGRFRDWDVESSQRRADETTDLAIEFLRGGNDAFFLWVHYWDMHDVFLLPDDDFMPPEEALARNRRGELQPNAALYAAEIRFVDHHFGRLLEALEEEGQRDDTVVVVVADHGEGMGGHGWWFHRLLYQEQIRVPLLMRIPGVAPGATIDTLVRTTDIFPTLLDYLGHEVPEAIDGRSLRPLLEGRGDAPRVAYADQINLFDRNAMMIQQRPNDDLLHSVQDQDWKLIYKPRHPHMSELYDLAADPGERKNLFRGNHPEAKRLLGELAKRNGWVTSAPKGAGMDVEARERLVELGYVGDDGPRVHAEIDWSYTPVEEFHRSFYPEDAKCVRMSGSPCVLVRTPPSKVDQSM